MINFSKKLKEKIVGIARDDNGIIIYLSEEPNPISDLPEKIKGREVTYKILGKVEAIKSKRTGRIRPIIGGISVGYEESDDK